MVISGSSSSLTHQLCELSMQRHVCEMRVVEMEERLDRVLAVHWRASTEQATPQTDVKGTVFWASLQRLNTLDLQDGSATSIHFTWPEKNSYR